jgi:hypothetical protein
MFMLNRAQKLLTVFHPLASRLSAEDQRVYQLIQGLQAYSGPELPLIMRGLLLYWLDRQPKESQYRALFNFSWLWRSQPTLSELIRRELNIKDKKPLDPYQQVSALAALLNYILRSRDTETHTDLMQILSARLEVLLFELRQPILLLLKSRPRAQALTANFSRLLSENPEKQEGHSFLPLVKAVRQQLALPEYQGRPLAYDAALGAVLHLMMHCDKKEQPAVFRACQETINVDSLKEVSAPEKMTLLAGLFYVLSKDPEAWQKKALLEAIIGDMNELLLEQKRCGSLRKVVFFALHNVEQVISYYLNQTMQRGLKQTLSYVDSTFRTVNQVGGSLMGFFSQQKASLASAQPACDKDFLLALATLPDVLFPAAAKKRLHNAFEIRTDLAQEKEERKSERQEDSRSLRLMS